MNKNQRIINDSQLKKLKISAVSVIVATVLSGCGGDSGNSETNNIPQNTAAVISGVQSGNITEDNESLASGLLTVIDPDAGEAAFIAQTGTQGEYGSLTLDAEGQWTHHLDHQLSAIQLLSQDDFLTESYSISSIDGTNSSITITINGADDTPTVSGISAGTLELDDPDVVTGELTITGGDADEDKFSVQTGTSGLHGNFSIAEEGNWSYSLTDTMLVDAVVETFNAIAGDGSIHPINITILAATFSEPTLTKGNIGSNDSVPEINCTTTVSSTSALEDAASYSMVAGETLCLAPGTYSGLELSYGGSGTESLPITIAAAVPGEVIISGEVSVAMTGEYVVLQGFIFKDGSLDNSIIQTRANSSTPCNHCRITENSLIDMDEGLEDTSKWVYIYGSYNRIDHNWFSGKTTRGALLAIDRYKAEGQEVDDTFEVDYAQIDHNYFGDRPPFEGKAYPDSSDNEFEGIRIGTSDSHQGDSYSVVEHNYFEGIQGEAEVISNKSGHNTIRHNTIRNSYGSIVNRHGEYATIENNFIFGDDYPFSGGIRIVDGNHKIVNNYIEGARYKDSNWNGGIVLSSGEGETVSGYQNVENVLIANNTIVDSVNSLNVFGGKENTPADGVYFVNNIINNAIGPVMKNVDDFPENSIFSGNIVYGQSFSDSEDLSSLSGMSFLDPALEKDSQGLSRPSDTSPTLIADNAIDIGDFEFPELDMDGQTRSENTLIGADEISDSAVSRGPLTSALVGPLSYTPPMSEAHIGKVSISNHDFDSGDFTGWTNNGAEISLASDDVFSRGYSLRVDDLADFIEQVIAVEPNTNYTLSSFVKGHGLLSVNVGGIVYEGAQSKDEFTFTSVSFNSADETSVTIKASLNPLVNNLAPLLNADFDDGEIDPWDQFEGDGIGKVQDSSNSAGGADGSIKLTYDGAAGGNPYDPYAAQSVVVEPNTEYTLSMYNLFKKDGDTTVLFGAFAGNDTAALASATPTAVILGSKDSHYATLKAAGTDQGDDSFYKDTVTFNSGDNTEMTIFAQLQTISGDGDEIRVDKFQLGYQGAPVTGSKAIFDSFRLVSHAKLD